VGIADLDNLDRGHRVPVESSVRLSGNGIVGGDEKQPVGLVEIDTELALAVTGHFMASGGGKSGNLAEVVRSTEFQQPLLELFGTGHSKDFLNLPGGGTGLLEFLGAEEYLHSPRDQNNSHDVFTFL